MKDQAHKAIAGALVGALLGWTGNALTLGGRVSAIEQSLIRIEARMDARQHVEAPK